MAEIFSVYIYIYIGKTKKKTEHEFGMSLRVLA